MPETIFGNTTTTPLNPDAFSGGGSEDLENYYTKEETDAIVGDIEAVLDELHNYARRLIGGAE